MDFITESEAPDFVAEVDQAGVGALWVSPHGAILFAGTGSGQVVELNALTGERLVSYAVCCSESSVGACSLLSCSADPGRTMIASAAGGGHVEVVDVASGAVIHRFDEPRPMAMAWCALDPKGRGLWHTAAPSHALVEFPTHVVLIDVTSGRELADLRRRPGSLLGLRQPGLSSVALSDGGERLALGFRDGTVGLLDAIDFKRLEHKRAHWDLVSACAFSTDGQLLVTGGYEHAPDVKVWSLPGLSKVATFEGHPGGVWTCAMSSDGETIAVGGKDGLVILHNLSQSQHEQALEGHTDFVTAVAFAPSGRRLFSASGDGTVRAWSV